jgi:hypothetical protein
VLSSRRRQLTCSGPGEAARLQQVRHERLAQSQPCTVEGIAPAAASDAESCTSSSAAAAALVLCLLLNKCLGLIWPVRAEFTHNARDLEVVALLE